MPSEIWSFQNENVQIFSVVKKAALFNVSFFKVIVATCVTKGSQVLKLDRIRHLVNVNKDVLRTKAQIMIKNTLCSTPELIYWLD